MVKAATGGGGGRGGGEKHTELLPIVFIAPKLLPSLLTQTCPAGSLPYSLLGYGDVGVPGLLVALSLQFDMRRGTACRFWPYFCVASLGELQH